MKVFASLLAGVAGSALFGTRHGSSSDSVVHASAKPSTEPECPFSQAEFRSFPLVNVYNESHDTKVLRFALPSADTKSCLPLASCVSLRFVTADGKEVIRPYTPISRVDQQGYFEIMVKKYKGSQMGSHLHAMKKGDTIDAKGPWVKIPLKSNQYKTIGMIAGGTGIAPMFQVAKEILRTPKNTTEVSLIYASRRKEDVLLGNELNELMGLYPLFSPYYTLSQAPSNWMGGVGHVNKEMIKSFMPPPNRVMDSIILVCGPPKFMETVSGDKDFSTSPPSQGELKGILKELGYMPRHVFKF
jgi:cytochrome-b5 reductase